jgi:hypothetical protein
MNQMSRFTVQVTLSLLASGLCIYKLALSDGHQTNDALYWGGFTGVLAYWMPSPAQSNSTQKEEE